LPLHESPVLEPASQPSNGVVDEIWRGRVRSQNLEKVVQRQFVD
jgi:hypothetical protein